MGDLKGRGKSVGAEPLARRDPLVEIERILRRNRALIVHYRLWQEVMSALLIVDIAAPLF